MVDMIAMFWPGGAVWSPLLHAFYDGIGSYAWTIVVVMLIIKVLLTPLDFWQRRITAKNSQMQEKMKPELDKLKKQCAGNQQLYNQRQMEIYKKHNYSIIGSCVGMLANIAITMTIFITLYSVMAGIANENLKQQYPAIQNSYYHTLNEIYYGGAYDPNVDTYLFDDPTNRTPAFIEGTFSQADIDQALAVAEATYNDNNESFLWVKSLWRSDTVVSTIPSFDDYVSIAGIKYEDISGGLTADQQKTRDRAEYDMIMGKLMNDMGGNGYYGLVIITVLVTALSQLLLWLGTRKKNKKNEVKPAKPVNANIPGAPKPLPKIPPNMIMMIILPIIMLFFTLTANAAFAIYLITTYLVSSATIPLTTLISKKIDEKKEKAEKEKVEVSYRRK
ncbi:MAG: YidC/Oxa1 family membrane protein insertase [Christensenellaceae bacterium]|jgi:YidC/Oxa1 family membrane protein insertase|nr:YidC/Oxa1 family membrane protein insertase [Christensenellaceae bacterium]